jgi:DivIVA domain-containing protein
MSKRKRKREDAAEEVASGVPVDPASPRRLLPVDIQQKEFRLAFRGYNESDVDEFLDGVTEELARFHEENKRLLEQLEEGGGGGAAAGTLIQDAQRRAEDIVREAREQASALLAAGSGAAAPAPAFSSGGGEDLRPFLSREREFLKGLATLIQGHAESVKRDAQQLRTDSGASVQAPPPAFVAEEPASFAAGEPPAMEPAPGAPPIAAAGDDADAWGPEPREDPWSGDDGAPFAHPSTEPERPQGLEQTQAWNAPLEQPLMEDLPPSREPSTAAEPSFESPPAPESEPSFGRPTEGAWSNPFLETGLPDASPSPDDLRPDPITFGRTPDRDPAPGPAERREADPEGYGAPSPGRREAGPSLLGPGPGGASEAREAGEPAEAGGTAGIESDPPDREESDRSLRELFWGEE